MEVKKALQQAARIVHLYGCVGSAGRESLAVRAEGHALHDVRVPLQRPLAVARLVVPHLPSRKNKQAGKQTKK